MQGLKNDNGKPIASALLDFSRALLAVSVASTLGEKEYGRENWKNVENGIVRYADAGMRHKLKRNIERLDGKTSLPHIVHEAWNLLAELELRLKNGEFKDVSLLNC